MTPEDSEDSPKEGPRSPRLGASFGESRDDGGQSPLKNGATMMQAASSENTPRNKTGGEGTRNGQKGGNKKGIEKSKERDKSFDKSKNEVGEEKDAKSQQLAQPWRHSAEGDKIRVQSRHIKKH